MGSRGRFFLSHAGDDREAAKALAEGLRDAGLEVWVDTDDGALVPGKSWLEQLETALEGCAGYLVLVGRRGIDRWVRAEFDFALQRSVADPGFSFVPVFL